MNVIKRVIFAVVLFNALNIFSQEVNVDTPNLGFETGDLSGWEQYTGEFYRNGTGNTYEYRNWTPVINSDRIEVVSGLPNSSQDPIISCWDLPTNPDGIHPVRIGSTDATESTTAGVTAAEKLVYKFVVTENTSLLTFRYAAVMHCPDADHTGDQLPSFSVSMVVKNPAVAGSEKLLDCGNFTIRGDNQNASDIQLVKNMGANLSCTSSKVVVNNNYSTLKQYAYSPWKYGNVDLSQYIGEELTITLLNHDCMRYDATTGTMETCNHRSYGYFWAETKKLELKVKNCGSEDAEIVAPDGFEKYEWFRSDNVAVTKDPQNPKRAIIKQNQIKNGVVYSCRLSSDNSNCSDIVLSTELQEVGVVVDFDCVNECGGLVKFTNKTEVQGDKVNSCSWNFDDGTSSTHTDPEVRYKKPGEYNVTVTMRTDMGCTMSKQKKITVRNFPDLNIDVANDSVCYEESFKLTALNVSSGSAIKWNTGETTQSIQVDSIRFSQEYLVEVNDEYNCVYKDSVWINVKPAAMFDVIGDNEVCLHDSVTLTARAYSITSSEDMQFHWSTNETTPQIKVSPEHDGEVYTVVGMYKNGCSMKQSKTIKVNPTPTVSVTGTKEVCRGEEAIITADATQSTGEITYIWDDIHSGQNRTERPESTTTYTVRAVDERRCASLPKSHTVTVKPTPTLELKGDTIICEGMPTTLTVTSDNSSSIRWYDGTTGVSTITRKPSQDTTYWVEGETEGCRAYAEITVNLWFTPSIWVDGNTSICPGDVSILRAHGAHHYKWNNGQTTDSIVVQPSSSTTYTVYGYSDKDCPTSETVPVSVNPRPSIRTEGDHQACKGSLLQIVAIDDNPTEKAISFAWNNGAIGTTVIPQINEDSKFVVTAENKFGCVDSATHVVSMTTPPDISYQGENIVCLGDTITLQGIGALTYTWDDGEKQVTASSLQFRPATNMKIRLTGSNVSNCPSTLDIPVGVFTPPTLYLTGDSAVCQGSPFTLFVSGATMYEWSTGDRTSSITYNLDKSGKYTVYGTNDEGCTTSASMYVTVRPAPIITITKGAQTGCRDKADTINLYATGAVSYQWTSEPENESVARNGYAEHLVAYITEDTHFKVEGTDQYGCTSSTEYDIERLPRQELLFTVSPTFIEEGDSRVHFSGISPAGSKWYWEPGDGNLEERGENISHFYNPNVVDSFVVRVRAVDKYGCEYTGKQSIFTWIDFWAPEGFTPNGDDLNDSFKFYGGEYLDEFSYIIYNRLGEIIFEGQNLHEEWDGTINGEPCPMGVYGWYCKYKSNYKGVNREGDRRGFVSLIR